MNLAPICISTYTRIEHLSNTLRALANNPLAKESELYVFSDAPRAGDELAVLRIREMLRQVNGFKNVTITERETNDRVFNNRQGLKSLLEIHGRCIFLEEDVQTTPSFLSFMNEGLDYFEDQKKVFALCGYTPPLQIHQLIKANTFSCARFSAWGFGIWADRYNDIEMKGISMGQLSFIQKWRLRYAGTDLEPMTNSMQRGELEALDVRINFTIAKLGLKVVCPARTLSINRGHDGSGIHCGITNYFDGELDSREQVNWGFENAERQSNIDKALFYFRSRCEPKWKQNLHYHSSSLIGSFYK